MYATLRDFLRMPREAQARVTFLDLSIASDEDLYRARRRNPWLEDDEEYVGEAEDRGHR